MKNSQKRSILVTGGAGFIGSNFIRMLSQEEHGPSVVNLDLLTYAGNRDNLSDLETSADYVFVSGDIGDEAQVENLLREHQINGVIHFAAESHVDRSIDSPEPFFQTNVIGTLRLLNACRHYWKDLNENEQKSFRFLHVSTDEVYGSLEPDEAPFHESRKYEPNSPYSASKAASDHIVRSFLHTYGFPVVTTNCSNNYGPYQFPEKLIPLMILNALEGKPLPIYGDGQNIRDWLYVTDHCRGIWNVFQAGRRGETYNIGGLCERTNLEVIDTLCDILDAFKPREDGKSYREQKTFVPDRPGHDRRYAIDCHRIQEELGWKPRESFESGIQKTVAWYLENLDWCRGITEKRYQRERLGLESKS